MKKIIPFCLLSVALLMSLATNSQILAQSTNSSTSQISPENTALLQAAWNDLSTADHDYDGHRVKALKALKFFAQNNHFTLQEGMGKGGEAQVTSDNQMRDAQAKLQQVASALNLGKYPALAHALSEISTALSLSSGVSASPGPSTNPTPSSEALSANLSTASALIQSAYETLAKADANYGGHKVAAMTTIASVAQQLGVTLENTKRQHHGQGASDAMIKEALSQLQQASSILSDNNHQRESNALNRAINQLTVSVTIH